MIQQGRISDSIRGFPFLKQWGVGEYKYPDKPAIFVGCYNPPEDFKTIMSHKALGVLIWGGTDAEMIAAEKLRKLKAKTNIKHVAQSGFIARDLERAGIPYKRFPITTVPRVMDPSPLGDHVYCYAPRTRWEFYGGPVLNKVMKLLPDQKFIVTVPRQHSKERLFELYKRCFIGLRLTRHDGLPHTVVELGLRGRRCVFNDDIPGAIPWKNAKDIVRIINEEKVRTPGTTKVALDMYDFLDVSLDFLNKSYWECT